MHSQSSRLRQIFGHNYKWVSTLTLILILGLLLYFVLPQFSPSTLQSEGQPSVNVSARDVLLQDDFSDPNSGWPSENQPNASFGYQSPSSYYLEVSASNDRLVVSPELNLVNFTAETKVTVNYTNTPNGDFRYGLVVRRSGEHYYAFTISPRSGSWQVLKYAAGEVDVLAEDKQAWLGSTFRLYTLNISARDKTLSFRINEQPVAALSDPDYTSGKVGFIVETFDETLVRVTFDSLIVQKIQDAPAEVAAATSAAPKPTALLISTAIPKPATPTISATSPAAQVAPTSTLSPTIGPTPTIELMPTLPVPSPSSTITPRPSATSLPPTSTPSPTFTAIPPSRTPTLNPTPTSGAVPATSPALATPTPGSTPAPSATPTPNVPTGGFELLAPINLEQPSYGPTDFEWKWTGPVPAGFGFEVRVWREGEAVAGAHNAVLDNQSGNIKNISENHYSLNIDITDAAGVKGRKGEYLWTVALVQISPGYADLGQQAQPARLRFETPGGSGGGNGGGGGGSGGGGVGVQ